MNLEGKEIIKDKVVNVKQAEHPKEIKWSIQKIHKGHTLFEINLANYSINPASYEDVTANIVTGGVKRKVIQKPNCIYVSALNQKNALIKFQKQAEKYANS